MQKTMIAMGMLLTLLNTSVVRAADDDTAAGEKPATAVAVTPSEHSMINAGVMAGYSLYDIFGGGYEFGATAGFQPITHLEIAPSFTYTAPSFSIGGVTLSGSVLHMAGDIRYRTKAVGGFFVGASIGYAIVSATLNGSVNGLTLPSTATNGQVPSHITYGVRIGDDFNIIRNFSIGFDVLVYLGGLLPSGQGTVTAKFWL